MGGVNVRGPVFKMHYAPSAEKATSVTAARCWSLPSLIVTTPRCRSHTDVVPLSIPTATKPMVAALSEECLRFPPAPALAGRYHASDVHEAERWFFSIYCCCIEFEACQVHETELSVMAMCGGLVRAESPRWWGWNRSRGRGGRLILPKANGNAGGDGDGRAHMEARNRTRARVRHGRDDGESRVAAAASEMAVGLAVKRVAAGEEAHPIPYPQAVVCRYRSEVRPGAVESARHRAHDDGVRAGSDRRRFLCSCLINPLYFSCFMQGCAKNTETDTCDTN